MPNNLMSFKDHIKERHYKEIDGESIGDFADYCIEQGGLKFLNSIIVAWGKELFADYNPLKQNYSHMMTEERMQALRTSAQRVLQDFSRITRDLRNQIENEVDKGKLRELMIKYINFCKNACDRLLSNLYSNLNPIVLAYRQEHPVKAPVAHGHNSSAYSAQGVVCNVTIVFGADTDASHQVLTHRWLQNFGYSANHGDYEQLFLKGNSDARSGKEKRRNPDIELSSCQHTMLKGLFEVKDKSVECMFSPSSAIHAEDDWTRRYAYKFLTEAQPYLENHALPPLKDVPLEVQLETTPRIEVLTSFTACSRADAGGDKFDGCQKMIGKLRESMKKQWGQHVGMNMPMVLFAYKPYHKGEPNNPVGYIDEQGDYQHEGHTWRTTP